MSGNGTGTGGFDVVGAPSLPRIAPASATTDDSNVGTGDGGFGTTTVAPVAAHSNAGSAGNTAAGRGPTNLGSGGPAPEKAAHGIAGLIGNFGLDVKGAVEGLPTGIEGLATHPIRAAKNIGGAYRQTYSPLFHGHFGQFAHELYAHPLGPLLDALTVLTLGAGGTARAGEVLSKAGAISDTSRLATLGKASDLAVPDFGGGEDIVVKQTSRNPVVRLRQTAVHDLLNKIPSETPVVGSTARGLRALMREPERTASRLQGAAQRFNASFGQLSKQERAAWHLKARAITPSHYVDYLSSTGEKVPAPTLRLLSDPRVARLVEKPSAKLRTALDEGHALSAHLTALRVAGGHVDELTALESPYRHLRIANGATYEPETVDSPALKAAAAERDRIASLHEEALQAEKGWHASLPEKIDEVAGRTGGKSVELGSPYREKIVTLGHALEVAQQHVARLAGSKVPTGAVRLTDKPGHDLETLMGELDASGGEHPFYVPDSARTERLGGRFGSRPAGYSAPEQGVKQSRGVLFSKGLINFNDNALARDYRSFASQARAQLIHDELVKHAAILPKGEQIPHGYEELKLNRGQASAPYTARVGADLEHELSDATLRSKLAELSRQAVEQGNPEEPHTLVVPRQVRKLVEDNSRSYRSNLRKVGYDLPTNVWKHLILGLRPAFFGNITIGNSILGMLQMAPGRHGLAGWLNQVVPHAEAMLGPKLTEETMRNVFPEQAYGTFGQSVGFSPNAGLRTAQKAYQGVMPATIAYENVLRRSMAEGWAKATPEVQRLMRGNGGDVNGALQTIAKTHPQIINGISRRVDDALGNYRIYNRLERALKAVVPFYGWNRHLTSSVVRLALERPQVLDAIYQTGQEGEPLAHAILAALPEYLQGSLPAHLPSWLGGKEGEQQLLTMSSLNPFSTLIDEGNIGKAAFGKPGASSDAFPLNPFAQAAIEQLTGTSLLTGHPTKGNAFKREAEHLTPLQGLLHDLIHGRHVSPDATNKNGELGQLLRYLGLPVENVDR